MTKIRVWTLALAGVGAWCVAGWAAEPEGNAAEASDPLGPAWQHVRYYEFDRAEPLFRQARKDAQEGTELWKQATFGLAVSLHYLNPPSKTTVDESAALMTLLAERYAKEPLGARATMELARIYEMRDYYQDVLEVDKARELYRKVMSAWPTDPVAGEAALRLAQSYVNTFDPKDVQQGVSLLTDWLKGHPQDKLAGVMWLYLADVYFCPLEDYRSSVDAYIKADERKSLEPGQEGFFYWRIAVLAERELKDRDLAIRYYTKLIREVPSYGKGYQAQLALKRLGVPESEIPPLRWAPNPENAGQSPSAGVVTTQPTTAPASSPGAAVAAGGTEGRQ